MAIKFRAGDIVSIRGTVKHNFDPVEDEHVSIDLPGSLSSGVWTKPNDVTMVQQKIVLGDMVSFHIDPDRIRVGQVLAISNDHAWVDLGGGEYCTRMLSTVQRAEDEQ